MNRWTPALAGVLLAMPLGLVACGGSSSTSGGSGGGTSTAACTPVKGQDLVVLKDDKSSQAISAIVPIVRKEVAKPPLTTALNNVTKSLTQDKLVALNKAVSTDNQRPEDAAKSYVQSNNLATGLSGGSGPITVASANFSENQVLANIFAETLNAAGYTATVKVIGARALYEPALESNQAQVVAEYVSNLVTFLADKDKTPNIKATGQIGPSMEALNQLLAKRQLVALEPSVATDEVAFAVSSGSAQKYGLKTISDVAAKCGGGITLGGPPECHTRSDCQGALESTYGLKITGFTNLDEDGPFTRSSLKQGKVFMAEVFSSDPDLING
ncbi:MAG TPA: glycine betaine ABC transporter substrate-binding protein [Frankiaceae bacterium]|nr:glycine betaine ABC transporter substrate-binding protein [Frankiaceae bacterium]